MKKIFIIIFLAILCPACIVAKNVRKASSQSSGQLVFLADSIDFRSDLTRLYGRLSGQPHTSGRIDFMAVILNVKTVKPLEATDIDGVDFKRWFQWEEDGIIPIEIDFPPMTPVSSLIIEVGSPKGESSWKISVGKSTR